MKSFIKTTALSFLTVSSLSLAVAPQSQAFTSKYNQTNPITNQTIYIPEVEINPNQALVSKEELVAVNLKPICKLICKPIGGWVKKEIINPSKPENQRR